MLSVPKNKLEAGTTVTLDRATSEAAGSYACIDTGSRFEGRFSVDDNAFHYLVKPTYVTVFLNPISSFCGGWSADYVFSADTFTSGTEYPPITLTAGLTVFQTSVSPATGASGSTVSYGFQVTGKWDSSSLVLGLGNCETARISPTGVSTTMAPKFHEGASSTPQLCVLSGGFWVCDLHQLTAPVLSPTARWVYLDVVLDEATVGPTFIDVTVSAPYFTTSTVRSQNHTVYGAVTGLTFNYTSERGQDHGVTASRNLTLSLGVTVSGNSIGEEFFYVPTSKVDKAPAVYTSDPAIAVACTVGTPNARYVCPANSWQVATVNQLYRNLLPKSTLVGPSSLQLSYAALDLGSGSTEPPI